MRSTLLHEANQLRRYLLVFSTNDQVNETILDFATEEQIHSAQLSGIGGFSSVTLGYFDWNTKEYKPIKIDEQVEVVSFQGNLSMFEGNPKLHVHAAIGKSDGSAWAGHLLDAVVRPTLELFVTVFPGEIERVMDRESKIPLIRI